MMVLPGNIEASELYLNIQIFKKMRLKISMGTEHYRSYLFCKLVACHSMLVWY